MPPSGASTTNRARTTVGDAARWPASPSDTPVTRHSRGRSSGGRTPAAEAGVEGFRNRRLAETGSGRTGRGGAAGRTAGAAGEADEDMSPSNHPTPRQVSDRTHNQGSLRGSPHDAGAPPVDRMEA